MSNGEKEESVKNVVENTESVDDSGVEADLSKLSVKSQNEDTVQETPEPPVPVEYKLINKCYGGFGLSDEANEELKRRGGKESFWNRDCPLAIALFDEKGSEWCSGKYACLAKAPFPVGFSKWAEVKEYDGLEHLWMDWGQAFTDGAKEILAKEDGTIEEIRAWESKIEAAQEDERAIGKWELKKRGY